jgi:hypothetical protein
MTATLPRLLEPNLAIWAEKRAIPARGLNSFSTVELTIFIYGVSEPKVLEKRY